MSECGRARGERADSPRTVSEAGCLSTRIVVMDPDIAGGGVGGIRGRSGIERWLGGAVGAVGWHWLATP